MPGALDRLPDAGIAAVNARPPPAAPCDPATARFDALYAAYRPLLRKIAIRKFGIPPDAVDDLVHDVFATYLANPSNVRDLHPYLIGAICNASRQYRRRDDASPFCSKSVEWAGSPGDELVDGVVRNLIIGTTLSRLGVKCRETLQRFHLHGESAASIATSRNTSPNYICRLLNYCRNRARSIYLEMSTRS